MRLLPSILLPISLQENIQTISTADFFKLPLQAGVRPQQQLEDFRRTPSFDYKGAGTAEEMQSPTLCATNNQSFGRIRKFVEQEDAEDLARPVAGTKS